MLAWQMKENDHVQLATKEEFQQVQQKYPGLIPIIIHPKDVQMTKFRYLTRAQITLEQFAEIVRRYCIDVDPLTPLFLSINGVLIPKSYDLGKIYDHYRKSDGFLHIILIQEPAVASTSEEPVVNPTETMEDDENPKTKGNIESGPLPNKNNLNNQEQEN